MLDRRVGELSGGEAVLAAIAGIRLRGAADHAARRADEQPRPRARAARLGRHRPRRGAERSSSSATTSALLELMDDTAELYENELSVFGGPYSQWRECLDAEQDAARQAERSAAQLVETREARPHRGRGRRSPNARRWGARPSSRSGCRRSSRVGLQRAAEVSAGKLRTEHARPRERRARPRWMRRSDACATTPRSGSSCPIRGCPRGAASRRSATVRTRGRSRVPSASR